eukprot:TRINITY_DN56192_c0_g1_i1.p1 TRINITY_DN56192_c0_g1~~TRINITY_DN56192_c0_g1_i1.p1  ORF type:complete len:307 (+),score=41.77 TRINITY_DN56192_c0_g1_i1:110-922(+)
MLSLIEAARMRDVQESSIDLFPIFAFRACEHDHDILSGERWRDMSMEKLGDLVLIYSQANGFGRPACFLRSQLISHLHSVSSVSPWVGSHDDEGRGGAPDLSVKYQPFNLGGRHLLDYDSSDLLRRKPGCYRLDLLGLGEKVRFGARALGARGGHGELSQALPVELVQRIDCGKTEEAHLFKFTFVRMFCQDAVLEVAAGMNLTEALSEAAQADATQQLPKPCSCRWERRGGVQAKCGLKKLGACFSTKLKTSDQKMCCCPDLNFIKSFT